MDVCLAFLGRRLYITVRYVCMYVCTVVEHDRVVFCMVRRRKMELL